MGFAFPKMRQNLRALGAAVLLGIFWGLWHMPVIDYLGTATPHRAYWWPFFLSFTAARAFPGGSSCATIPTLPLDYRPGKLKLDFGKMQNYVEERDGGYYIAGTRISLDSIVHAFQEGESPEGILRSFPMAGPLVRIYGAITFYLENKETVAAYLKDQEQLWGALSKERGKPADPLMNRLRGAKEHTSPRRS